MKPKIQPATKRFQELLYESEVTTGVRGKGRNARRRARVARRKAKKLKRSTDTAKCKHHVFDIPELTPADRMTESARDLNDAICQHRG